MRKGSHSPHCREQSPKRRQNRKVRPITGTFNYPQISTKRRVVAEKPPCQVQEGRKSSDCTPVDASGIIDKFRDGASNPIQKRDNGIENLDGVGNFRYWGVFVYGQVWLIPGPWYIFIPLGSVYLNMMSGLNDNQRFLIITEFFPILALILSRRMIVGIRLKTAGRG